MTKNKMPRWLSEGISVFEELEANPAWGQRMNAQYREMILGGELTPVGELSSAFLAPKTPLHLQFAYYESALVVEFLVRNFGFDAIRRILVDLGEGVEINKAIAAHTTELEKIEKDFAAFAVKRAESLAPGLDFARPEPDDLRSTNWLAANPTNFWALQRRARNLVAERDWAAAKAPLEELVRRYPNQTGDDSVYLLLAYVHRELGDTNAERAVLTTCASQDAEALDAFTRLMKLGAAAGDWQSVYENAGRHLAVNPLVPEPHRHLAQAAEALGHEANAIRAWRVLLQLDPPDPAAAHYRLARLLHRTGDAATKREVLRALEEAPRFRDAHKLLRELQRDSKVDADGKRAESPLNSGR
jgi:tetratricopeptide (TPR) repeat protein